MIWVTLRQLRAEAAVVYAGLAVLAVILAVTGPHLLHLAGTSGSDVLNQVNGSESALYLVAGVVSIALPAIIGMFWGAPLVTRELDARTHMLVWNQSVTRTRWLGTKLLLTGLAAMAAAGLLSLAVTWWCSPIDNAADKTSTIVGIFLPRLTPLVFDARGIAPIGYAAFAFTLGVTLGALLRQTRPAMAATLVVFIFAQVAMAIWVRPHLVTPNQVTTPITTTNFRNMGAPLTGGMEVAGNEPGAWITSQQTVNASGQVVAPPASLIGSCLGSGPGQASEACFARVTTLGYRQQMTYHPASHFWLLQWYETAIFLGLAMLLGGFSVWWVRHRVS